MFRKRRSEIVVLALVISAGCNVIGPDCAHPPCPSPMAAVLQVTSSVGGPVPGLTMTMSGAVSGSGPCSVGASSTKCMVPGGPGKYTLRLAAAGFQEKTLNVEVQGSTPECGCTSVQTQQLDVMLTPN